jgi:hypothetical protein
MAANDPSGKRVMNGEDGVQVGEIPDLLNMLFDHRKAVIQNFLKSRDRAFSGTWEKLRERVEGYLGDGSLRPEELVDLLDQVEGWGNQHIYLYEASNELIDRWKTEAKARAILRSRDKEPLFNRRLPLVLPASPQLSTVEWTPEGVRFVWVEKRVWRERAPDEDFNRGEIEFTANRVRRARGIIAFDWDLVSGHAALLFQRLPSGNDYGTARRCFEVELEPLVKISKFEGVYISPAINALEKSGEVRHRQLEHATELGAKISFMSRARNVCALSDPALKKAREAVGDKLAGRHGNYYWPMPDSEKREIHVKLYAKDQRLGIFGECSEPEVRYVLRCVRGHCC